MVFVGVYLFGFSAHVRTRTNSKPAWSIILPNSVWSIAFEILDRQDSE